MVVTGILRVWEYIKLGREDYNDTVSASRNVVVGDASICRENNG